MQTRIRIGASLVTSLVLAGGANAQLTWDPDMDMNNNGGAGTWATTATNTNWETGGSNVAWDNTGANEAIFGDSGGDYTVSVATGSEVTVGNLTHEGTNVLNFASVLGDSMLTLAGNAAWDTGGGQIRFASVQSAAPDLGDVGLDLGGNTLTTSGGGSFYAGERGNGVDWTAGTLVFTEGTVVRGAGYNIGQLTSVSLAGGSTFVMERNSNQNINNDWVLNGDSTFGNRFGGRTIWANGEFSGTGRLTVQGLNTQASGNNGFFRLNNAANSWSGGLTVNGGINYTVVEISGADDRLGAVPVSLDADNIILQDGGVLKMNNMNLNANRGITLEGTGGVIVNRNNPNTINGPITGVGSLSIGSPSDGSANVTILKSSANDYAGDTNIVRGTLRLGVDNATPDGALMVIGCPDSSSTFDMDGFDTTIAGLTIAGSNTRQIQNNGGSDSTLTFDVPDGESHSWAANVTGSNIINLEKDGLGTQSFDRNGGYTTGFGGVTVNEGTLGLGNNNGTTGVSGAISVTGGSLLIGEELVGVNSVSVTGGVCRISADNYLGDLPVSQIADFITLDGGTLNVYMEDTRGGSFEIDEFRGITLGANGGTIQTTTPSGAWVVAYNGEITGTGTLTKTSGQTLELGGANTYTGATFVDGGTFRLSGSLTSDVTVQGGVFIAGDFATGTGAGTMNALGFDATGNMTSFINSDSSEAGKAIVGGAVSIDPEASLNLGDRGATVLAEGIDFVLIDYTGGSLSGAFEGLLEGSTVTVGLNNYTLSYTGGSGSMVTLTSAGASSAYTTWAAGYPGLMGGFDDDDDMDGLSNGEEWYFGGTDPLNAGDGSPLLGVESTGTGVFEFTHLRPVDTTGSTATYQWSSTLAAPWNASGDTSGALTVTLTPEAATPADPGYEQVTVTVTGVSGDPGDLDKIFARVLLTMP
ncbi:beta strand repeat-containing protein [Haloferula sp.]|uniref:beta strand repeat-containing protein n=1 Tax=Haloferula sp. TaxID=2497595 RepID=UPI0032A11214